MAGSANLASVNLLSIASRLAIGLPYAYFGYQTIKEPGGRPATAEAFGVPAEYAELSVKANGAVMVAGGLAVAAGVLPRLGAAAVAGAMVPTSLAGHAFWKETDPAAVTAHRTHFLKNLVMIGGLLAVAAMPSRRRPR